MYIENNQLKKYLSIWLVSMFWIIALMIIVGGLTRLTDSGLSITTWELFSGFLPPLKLLNGKIILIFIKKFQSIKFKIIQ